MLNNRLKERALRLQQILPPILEKIGANPYHSEDNWNSYLFLNLGPDEYYIRTHLRERELFATPVIELSVWVKFKEMQGKVKDTLLLSIFEKTPTQLDVQIIRMNRWLEKWGANPAWTEDILPGATFWERGDIKKLNDKPMFHKDFDYWETIILDKQNRLMNGQTLWRPDKPIDKNKPLF